MRYSSKLITVPAQLPVEEVAFSQHMRGLGCGEEELALTYLKAATEAIERFCSLALITQTWDVYVSGALEVMGYAFDLPRTPVQSISSVNTVVRGVETLVDSGKYFLEPQFARVILDKATLDQSFGNGLKIRYIAGFGNTSESVPADLQNALLMLAGHFYERRLGERALATRFAAEIVGSDFPPGVHLLLGPYRKWLT